MTHAIIEIEEGSLNVVVGRREGAKARVVRSLRVPLQDVTKEAMLTALRTIGSDVLGGADGVHVVLGDRRTQHFLSTVPRMSAKDAIAFVTREALRLASVQSAEDILLSTRHVRRLPGKKMLLGTTALARSTWGPIRTAFEQSSLNVLGLYSMEECMAMGTKPDSGKPVALVECNAGRARFVLCVDQTPVQVRRFLIGSGSQNNPGALAMQLAMELPRTFDWLRETGQPMPSAVFLGARLGVDDDTVEMLKGEDVSSVRVATLPVVWDEGQAVPSLAVAALLRRLVRATPCDSLLSPPRLRLPWSGRLAMSTLAAASIGVLCSYTAVINGEVWWSNSADLRALEKQANRIEAQLPVADDPDAMDVEIEIDPAIESALKLRRPVSRLISELSNSADDDVHVEELQFSSVGALTVVGQVEGSSRPLALEAMARFTHKLRELPYVQTNGQEEVGEVAGQWNRFRFKLVLAWRNE